ncbi:hypothetical protein [Actinoplanes sp. HUAS TT8]|uniref:hypothetical protein n=1 Tax=Actinoplanes sp. HUAS TT8 TaxID=3447453 RepID=UPI003F51EE20
MFTGVRPRTTRRFAALIAGGVLAALAAGIVTWVLWPEPEPRQREYTDATACLLTDEQGITGPQASPVWSVMSETSAATLVRVQYLSVIGPQDAGNAGTYLASLAAGRCSIVVAVGDAQVAAVAPTAKTFPAVSFVSVGGGTAGDNVTVVPDSSADTLRDEIKRLVESLAPRD